MLEKLTTIGFVLVLSSILTGSLITVNNFTKPIIEKNVQLKMKRSVLTALDIAYDKENLESVFSETVKEVEQDNKKFFISKNNEVAFEIKGSGLWGPIRGILCMQPDLETIKGITIIHQEETPGLGGRIGEDEYLQKFRVKKIVPEIKVVSPGKANAENEVDGITGATLSCKAFEKILNEESKKYLPIVSKIKR